MSNRFSNQTLAIIVLGKNGDHWEVGCYTLPKHLDEEAGRLHVEKMGAKRTTRTQKQADYIGVQVGGRYKPEAYRY